MAVSMSNSRCAIPATSSRTRCRRSISALQQRRRKTRASRCAPWPASTAFIFARVSDGRCRFTYRFAAFNIGTSTALAGRRPIVRATSSLGGRRRTCRCDNECAELRVVASAYPHLAACAHSDRAQQTGRKQLVLCSPQFPGSKGVAAGRARLSLQQPIGPTQQLLAEARDAVKIGRYPFRIRWQLFVANEPIGPEIGDLDLQPVTAGFEYAGRVGEEGRLPQNAEIMAIDPYASDHLDLAEVENRRDARREHCGRDEKLTPIDGCSRKKTDARIVMFGPRGKLRESDAIRCAPDGSETHFPGPARGNGRRQVRHHQRQRRPARQVKREAAGTHAAGLEAAIHFPQG